MDLLHFFERVYVVSLPRRPDRLAGFQEALRKAAWPFKTPEVFPAIDGQKVPHPPRWTQGGGAWGCLMSHQTLIQKCLNENVQSVLLMEDDALPCTDFTTHVTGYLSHLPQNWQMLYLGGQHLYAQHHPPQAVNEWVVRPFNVNRTHAFALTRSGMKAVYLHLLRCDWHPRHHIDHHLGRLHGSRAINVYCPTYWLIGQAQGKSNIAGRVFAQDRFWQPAKNTIQQPPPVVPFVAVVGLHSSGSSAIAGVCWHLGVYMGGKLTGFYGNNPNKRCGFEADELQRLCHAAAPFPSAQMPNRPATQTSLEHFIRRIHREATAKGQLAGGKFPTLCQMGDMLQAICGDQLRIIHCDRPLDDSIASLRRRQAQIGGRHPPKMYDANQRWLWEGKQKLLAAIPPERKLDVSYNRLTSHPDEVVEEIRQFLNISSTPEQISKAIASVRPDAQHIGKAVPA